MSTKLKAGTATSGAVIDADTSGILELQSGSTPTTAITVDASQGVNTSTNTYLATTAGNVGVGTVTATSKLDLYGNFQTYRDGTYIGYVGKGSGVVAGAAVSDFGISSTPNMVFGTGAGVTERMRINSSGSLLVGMTATTPNISGDVAISKGIFFGAGTTSTYYFSIQSNTSDFYIGNSTLTRYAALNGINTFTAWSFGSDRRIKKDIESLDYGLTQVMQMKPSRYKFIDGEDASIGFIAQELKEVIPEAVTGEEMPFSDEDTPQERAKKTMGVSKDLLIPVLVKAIQELNAKVTALEEQVINLGVK